MSQRGRYKRPRHFKRGPFYHGSKNTDGDKQGNNTYDNFSGVSLWRPQLQLSRPNGNVPAKKVPDWRQTLRLDSNDSFKYISSNKDVPGYRSRAPSSDADQKHRMSKDAITRPPASRPQLQLQKSQQPRTRDPRLRLKQKQIEKQKAQLLEQKSVQKRNDKLELQHIHRQTSFPTQPKRFNDEKRHNELPIKPNLEQNKPDRPSIRPNSLPSKPAENTQLRKDPKLSREVKKAETSAPKPLNSNLFINRKETKRKLQHFREEMRKRQLREEPVGNKHAVINDVDESSYEEDEELEALFSLVPTGSGSLAKAAALNALDHPDSEQPEEEVPEKFDLPDYVQTIKVPPSKVIDISESESDSDPDAPEYTHDTPKNRKKRDPTSDSSKNSKYPSRLQQLTEQRDKMRLDNQQGTSTASIKPQLKNISKNSSKASQSKWRSSIAGSLKEDAKKNGKAEIDEEQGENGKADGLSNFNGYDGDDEEKDDDFSSDEDDVIDISNQANDNLFKETDSMTENKIYETKKLTGPEEKLFVDDSDADLSAPPVPKKVNINFNTSLLKKKTLPQKSGELQDLLKSNIEQETGELQDHKAFNGEDGNVVIKPPIREHHNKRLGSIIQSSDDEQSVPELITEQKSPLVKKRRRLVRKSREPKERVFLVHDEDSESDSDSDIELIGEVKVNTLSPVTKKKSAAIRRRSLVAKRKALAKARRN